MKTARRQDKYRIVGWSATGDGISECSAPTKREALISARATLEASDVFSVTVYRGGEVVLEKKNRAPGKRVGMPRCSLVRLVDKPLMGKPFGRPARWLLRMVCGAVHDSNLLEPPVSIPCSHMGACRHEAPAPPRKVRPPFEW